MLSIGKFAKEANVSPRALRHYESLGLIEPSVRGDNNYRYYEDSQLGKIEKIRDLQRLGFSLDEVRDVLSIGTDRLSTALAGKLASVEAEMSALGKRRDRLKALLAISSKIQNSQAVRLHERRLYMDAVKEEVIKGIKSRLGGVSQSHLDYLSRERSLYDSPEKKEFIDAVKQCIDFARENDLTLGPGRGSCPASMILYGLGFTGIDPTQYDLLPERLSSVAPDIHIDVEYERGQQFVDLCRRKSEELSWGKITAFKMPLIDILARVHNRIGGAPDYRKINDNDDLVLGNIRRGDIDKIFLFDYSPNALVMKYENHFDDYVGTEKIKNYLRSQTIESFRDVVNIISVWRPNHEEKIQRIDRYREAKTGSVRFDFLTPDLQTMLEPNYGVVIYHEDLVRVIAAYTEWDLERCSKLRRDIRLGYANPDLEGFKHLAPEQVFNLVIDESPWTFCKSHAMSFAQFTKMTSILKSMHSKEYSEEIARWEDQNGLAYDDIGIKIKGVSLLQH